MRCLRVVLATVLLVATAACTGEDGEQPDDVAKTLAEGLSRGRPASVPFVGAGDREVHRFWSRSTEGMGDSTVEVVVDGVAEAESGETATARLRYRWTLAGTDETWTQAGTARLVHGEDDRWRVRLDPALLGLHRGERLDVATEAAPRAPILGQGDQPLVTDRPVLRFGIDKTKLVESRAETSAHRLAEVLDVNPADLASRVQAAGAKAFVEAIVLRKHDAAAAQDAIGDIPGAVALPDTLPLAPTREFARPLLGSVGPVTAEIIEESDGAYRIGDEAGLSGLQQRYDEQLRGTPGLVVRAVSRDGDARVLHRVAPLEGRPLRTSLDLDLQRSAEQILAGVSPASAIVALRASTGEIVAAASGPGSDGYSTATLGQYAPGSTFKVVSSLALLRAGLTPASPLSCPRTTVVDGKQFKNYDDYPTGRLGRITLRDAVANSCNTAFIEARDKVEDLPAAAAALGLGVDHDLGFPVFLGSVPPPDSETGHAASLIGQGRVLASPVAMAAVVGSVMSGRTVVPTLLPDQTTPEADADRPLTDQEARLLRSLMRSVVTDGSGRLLLDVPGPPVIAKTGTAEFGEQQPPQTHAWMVAGQGDLAVAVFVDVGDSGSGTAGPLLEQFLRAADVAGRR